MAGIKKPVTADNMDRCLLKMKTEAWRKLPAFIYINQPFRQKWFVLFLLVITGGLVYSNTTGVPFYFDDIKNIEKSFAYAPERLSFDILDFNRLTTLLSDRPVSYMSLALNYSLSGWDVTFYHIFNTAVHIFAGISLYFLLLTTLTLSSFTQDIKNPVAVSFFSSLIWLVHPIQTQSVTYVVQRMNSMAALFFVLSLLLYARGRLASGMWKKRGLFAGSLLSGILALGSKEIAATLPFFVMLYEWFFFQNLSTAWIKKRLAFILGACIFFLLIVRIYTGPNILKEVLAIYAVRDFTLMERVYTEFRVVIFYISLLLYPNPSRLSLLHEFELSHSLFNPATTFLSAAIIACAVVAAIVLARKQRFLSFSILWFLGNLIIESSVIGLEIIFEHRTYLPSMFFFALLVVAVYKLFNADRVVSIIFGILLILLCFWTLERNRVWKDPVAFWKDNVRKAPTSYRAYNNLGRHFIMSGNYNAAISQLKLAVRLAPSVPLTYSNLGLAYAGTGDYKLSIDSYEKALARLPLKHSYQTYSNLGLIYRKMGQPMKAIDTFKKAISVEPDFAKGYHNLGLVYLENNAVEKAIAACRKSIEIDPFFADTYMLLGQAFISKGLLDNGIKQFEKAVKLDPAHVDANFNLARAYELAGRYKPAMKHYEKSMLLDPGDSTAYHHAGMILIRHFNNRKKGMAYLEKALSVNADYPMAPEARNTIKRIQENTSERAIDK